MSYMYITYINDSNVRVMIDIFENVRLEKERERERERKRSIAIYYITKIKA